MGWITYPPHIFNAVTAQGNGLYGDLFAYNKTPLYLSQTEWSTKYE